MSTNPETSSGMPAYALPEFMSFSGAPAGAYTDSEYLASEAALRNDIASQYADILAQLGYIDPATGAFLPGSVQQATDLQESQLRQQEGEAVRGVTANAQNTGILFSGIRGLQEAQARVPTQQQIGALELQTPLTLAGLYRQASGLINDYNLGNMALLSAAAQRGTEGAITQPAPPPAEAPPPPAPTETPVTAPTTPLPSGETTTPVTIDTGTTGGGTSGGTTPAWGLPGGEDRTPRSYALGGEVEYPQLATMGESARPGDPLSHEVIVPRQHLLPEENSILTRLALMARLRAGMRRPPVVEPQGMDVMQAITAALANLMPDVVSRQQPGAEAPVESSVPRTPTVGGRHPLGAEAPSETGTLTARAPRSGGRHQPGAESSERSSRPARKPQSHIVIRIPHPGPVER